MLVNENNQGELKQFFIASIFSAVSTLAIAVMLLIAWISPLAFGDAQWVFSISLLVFLEFVTLHAGVILASHALNPETSTPKIIGIVMLVIFYLPFIGIVGYLSGGMTVGLSYTALLLTRVWTLFTSSHENKKLRLKRSLVSLGILIVSIFIAASIPLPNFGITSDLTNEIVSYWAQKNVTVNMNLKVSIAAGFIYFTALAVFELINALQVWKSRQR